VSFSKTLDLTGRNILITGGAGFLGRQVAEALIERGASIVILDRPGRSLIDCVRSFGAKYKENFSFIECDLESECSRNSALEKIREDRLRLDSLINNAAFCGSEKLSGWASTIENQSLETWRRALEVNITAPFHFCRELAPTLAESSNGSIVNIASIYGEVGPDWGLYQGLDMGNPAAYAVSKGGLIQLTRWLATTLAPSVRVNAVSPGGLYRGQSEVFVERYCRKTPLNRMGVESDIVGAIFFLVSEMSVYCTGQVYTVDGGFTCW